MSLGMTKSELPSQARARRTLEGHPSAGSWAISDCILNSAGVACNAPRHYLHTDPMGASIGSRTPIKLPVGMNHPRAVSTALYKLLVGMSSSIHLCINIGAVSLYMAPVAVRSMSISTMSHQSIVPWGACICRT